MQVRSLQTTWSSASALSLTSFSSVLTCRPDGTCTFLFRAMSTLTSYSRWVLGAAILGLSTLSQPSFAQKTFDVSVLAGSCANCHGTDGRSQTVIPNLAGQPEEQLRQKLYAFKSENPPANTTVMDRLVKTLSDEQMDALAQYFATIPTNANQGAN